MVNSEQYDIMAEPRKERNEEFPQIRPAQGYQTMAGKRKNFMSYSAAVAFVATLGLTSMQDWIAYAKGKDTQKRVRPDDLPSNPWTVYKDELAALTPPQKFSINTFIGCKLPRKARTPKADKVTVAVTPKVTTTTTPKATKGKTKTVDAPVVTQTPFEIAKMAIQALGLKNREAFYELKRKNMLPVGVPRKPDDTFKADWKGWGDFLGNGNVSVAAKAAATF